MKNSDNQLIDLEGHRLFVHPVGGHANDGLVTLIGGCMVDKVYEEKKLAKGGTINVIEVNLKQMKIIVEAAPDKNLVYEYYLDEPGVGLHEIVVTTGHGQVSLLDVFHGQIKRRLVAIKLKSKSPGPKAKLALPRNCVGSMP